jgi:hypothetical protein
VRNVYRILIAKLIVIGKRILLKWNMKKYDLRMYTSSSQQMAWPSEHRTMLHFTQGQELREQLAES